MVETEGFTPSGINFESYSQHNKNHLPKWVGDFYGGDGGIRTLDLSDANRTLSQLSYAPK